MRQPFAPLTSAVVLLASTVALSGAAGELHITALGNEGFLVTAGDTVVLFDGLYRGLDGYDKPSPAERERRETAEPPFDGVDLVLVSHDHPDHFDPASVARHLMANPGAELVTTTAAIEQVRRSTESSKSIAARVHAVAPAKGERVRMTVSDIEVQAMALHHGRGRESIQNLGLMIDIDGFRVLHLGDTEATPEELSAFDLAGDGIDVAFVPYWHLLSADHASAYRKALGDPLMVAMHLPAPDAPPVYFAPAHDLEGVVARLKESDPEIVVLLPPDTEHVVTSEEHVVTSEN